ncbi:anthranilate phosphoribosyltransferase [Hydrogenimonas sp.]
MADGSQTFIRYLKCVGTGAKHNRDLTPDEMRDAMRQMLSGEASPEQTAAFLLGWRLKPESVEEFRAALDVLDAHTRHTPVKNGLELGYPFDGKADNPYLFPLAAQMVAHRGLRVVVSGGALQPAKGGVTVRDVCRTLPMPGNLVYFDRENYCPPLAALSPVRQKLGLRTGLNTLERLPDVGHCDTALIGVFHKPYVQKYVEIFGNRYKRLVIVKGNEGTPEVFGKCRLWLCEGGEVTEHTIDPKSFGIDYAKSFERIDAKTSLAMLREPSEGLMRLARLNAALWLWAKGEAQNLEEGWERLGG